MKNFALIGAAGYVAPKHMKAINKTGNELIAAFDPSDSVGIIDQYFPHTDFFVEFERFDRHLEKLKRNGKPTDFVSVCSPNYLHDAHCRFGLRLGANVICEKPVVLNPWNINALRQIESESNRKIFVILQLRLHPVLSRLKQSIEEKTSEKIYDIELTYITARGNWYYTSWKGDESKSGGIATNIGVHLFDMLIWIFGKVQYSELHLKTRDRVSGYIELKQARVRWFLSINQETIPETLRKKGHRTFRSLIIDGQELEFSKGFDNLHTNSYRKILQGKGFTLEDCFPAIELLHSLRNTILEENPSLTHPFSSIPLSDHPFHA